MDRGQCSGSAKDAVWDNERNTDTDFAGNDASLSLCYVELLIKLKIKSVRKALVGFLSAPDR